MSQLLGATSVPGDAAGDGAADIVAAAGEALGGLDGLVNNAGVVTASRLETVSSEEWDRVMHVNVRSVFQMSRAFAAVADVPASVVNLASIAATHPNPGTHAYTASKAAVVGLTRQAAVEWGPEGIRSNAVAPAEEAAVGEASMTIAATTHTDSKNPARPLRN